jgi:hypothetical protein
MHIRCVNALLTNFLAGKAANKRMFSVVSKLQNSTYSQVLLAKAVPADSVSCVCARAAALRVQLLLSASMIAAVLAWGV